MQRFLVVLLALLSISSLAYDYDLIVIGGGAAGLTACKLAAEKEKRVLLIEKEQLGGGRVWHGDVPFNVLFKISDIYQMAHAANTFGISIDDRSVTINDSCVFKKINTIQHSIHDVITESIEESDLITVKYGSPHFIDNHTLFCDGIITADKFIIATGSHPYIPPLADNVPYYTHMNFFDQKALPKSIIIIGGGPIGVELASALSRLDIKVTIIMKYGVILPSADLEMTELITKQLINDGVTIKCDMKFTKAEYDESTQCITVFATNRAHQTHSFKAEQLFFACGSRPNIETLKLENAGVTTTPEGIKVNSQLQTSAPNIWACGMVINTRILTHLAYQHAIIAIHNMYKPFYNPPKIASTTSIFQNLYIQPPHASIGMTELEAIKEYGRESIMIYRSHYNSIERSYIDETTEGLVKFICTHDGFILGVHIFGAHAHELINFVQINGHLSKLLANINHREASSPSYFNILELGASVYNKEKNKPPALKYYPIETGPAAAHTFPGESI